MTKVLRIYIVREKQRLCEPRAPAQELALANLMISPGVPGLPNKVRKFGVGLCGVGLPAQVVLEEKSLFAGKRTQAGLARSGQ